MSGRAPAFDGQFKVAMGRYYLRLAEGALVFAKACEHPPRGDRVEAGLAFSSEGENGRLSATYASRSAFSKAFTPPDDVLGRRLRGVPPRLGQEEKYLVRVPVGFSDLGRSECLSRYSMWRKPRRGR